MSIIHHFNAFPESVVCYPEWDNSSLQLFIPLLTESFEANCFLFKKDNKNPEILDLLYIMEYKPKIISPDTTFKFYSFKLSLSDLNFTSNIKFIRHRILLTESNNNLGHNLSERPFGAIRTQSPIPTIPSFAPADLYNDPAFLPGQEAINHNLRTGNIVVVDSCTIPPGGNG